MKLNSIPYYFCYIKIKNKQLIYKNIHVYVKKKKLIILLIFCLAALFQNINHSGRITCTQPIYLFIYLFIWQLCSKTSTTRDEIHVLNQFLFIYLFGSFVPKHQPLGTNYMYSTNFYFIYCCCYDSFDVQHICSKTSTTRDGLYVLNHFVFIYYDRYGSSCSKTSTTRDGLHVLNQYLICLLFAIAINCLAALFQDINHSGRITCTQPVHLYLVFVKCVYQN